MKDVIFPEPKDFLELTSEEGRKALVKEWLDVWFASLAEAPFSAQEFMDAAQQRLRELSDWADSDPNALEFERIQFDAKDYDWIKEILFAELEKTSGVRFTQTYNDKKNRLEVAKAKEQLQ